MNEWIALQSQPRSTVTAGGLCRVYGVPLEWIQNIPRENPLSQTITDDIALAAGRSWIPFIWASASKTFSEEGRTDNGQPIWETRLNGAVYWNPSGQHIQAGNVVYHLWVFLVKEAGTGNYYLVGTQNKGARMGVSYQSRPGTKTEFTAAFRSMRRAPIYTGAIAGESVGDFGIFSPQFALQFV